MRTLSQRASNFARCAVAILALLPSASAFSGSTTLTWTAPTQNEDGTPLTDLAGFNIYKGCTQSGLYDEPPILGIPATQTTVVASALPENVTCYFVATAYNDAGVESTYSNEATKFIESTVALSDPVENLSVTWQETGEMIEVPWTNMPPFPVRNFDRSNPLGAAATFALIPGWGTNEQAISVGQQFTFSRVNQGAGPQAFEMRPEIAPGIGSVNGLYHYANSPSAYATLSRTNTAGGPYETGIQFKNSSELTIVVIAHVIGDGRGGQTTTDPRWFSQDTGYQTSDHDLMIGQSNSGNKARTRIRIGSTTHTIVTSNNPIVDDSVQMIAGTVETQNATQVVVRVHHLAGPDGLYSTNGSSPVTGSYSPRSSTTMGLFATQQDNTGNTFTGNILFVAAFDKGLKEQELRDLYRNPWQIFEPQRIAVFVPDAGAGQTISAAGAIATGETHQTDHSIALSTRQSISAAGAIATGETHQTDHSVALSVRQAISGTVGAILSGESFANDHNIEIFRLTIDGAGAIASGESFATDHDLQTVSQIISAAGGIASAEAFQNDHALALSIRQSITNAGAIASAESLLNDHVIQSVSQIISAAGAIASGETFETDSIIFIPGTTQFITSAGAIASDEAFQNDSSIATTSQPITAAGAIATGEVVPSLTIALAARQIIDGITAITSGESFLTDHEIQDVLLQIICESIVTAEVVSTGLTVGDAVTDNPAPYSVAGTGLGADSQIHCVSVARTFGGAVGDVFIQGVRHTVNGAMYVTFDGTDASDVYINGIRHTNTGIRYVVNAAGSDKWPEGFGTQSGVLGTTQTLGGFYLRAIARTIDGRMVIDL